MKLYYSKGACSLVVRIVINEIGLPCEYEAVDLKTKQTETGADFLKINPKGSVPTLVLDNNEVLTENAIIQIYLAEQNKATQLLPPNIDFNHYRVLEWLNFITTDLHKGFSPIFNPVIPEQIKEEIFKPILMKKFTWLDEKLNNNNYLMGDHYTLPDGYLFVMLRWATSTKVGIEKLPNLQRYFDNLKNRPAIKIALQAEGLE